MEEKSILQDNGYQLVKDLEAVTMIYMKMNKREDIPTILSASSMTYLMANHRIILNAIDDEEEKAKTIETVKALVCERLDHLLKHGLKCFCTDHDHG